MLADVNKQVWSSLPGIRHSNVQHMGQNPGVFDFSKTPRESGSRAMGVLLAMAHTENCPHCGHIIGPGLSDITFNEIGPLLGIVY